MIAPEVVLGTPMGPSEMNIMNDFVLLRVHTPSFFGIIWFLSCMHFSKGTYATEQSNVHEYSNGSGYACCHLVYRLPPMPPRI